MMIITQKKGRHFAVAGPEEDMDLNSTNKPHDGNEDTITWHIFPGRGAKWKRMVAVTTDGRIFLPAALCGNETIATLNAAHDGAPALCRYNHVYLPTDWIVTDQPWMEPALKLLPEKLGLITRE